MDFISEAISQNGHWQDGEIAFPRVAHSLVTREITPVFEESIKNKFVTILRGLRRTGKSILSRQAMQTALTKGAKPREVCWFEFDRSMQATPSDLDTLLKFFAGDGESKLVVLDEIVFVPNWQDVLKRHYDLSNTKFIVTGSSALELDKRSSESLAGRFEIIKVKPFSFAENLLLTTGASPKTQLELVKKSGEMQNKCNEYLKTGGLPEAIPLNNEKRREFIKNSILEPLFFKDIPGVFPNANPDLLLKTLELLSGTVGSTFQFQQMVEVLGCSHPVIATQVEILCKSLVVSQLFNYTPSIIKQKRTAKKIIFADNGILNVLNPEKGSGALAENLVGSTIEATHFWRDSEGREVDFLLPEKKIAIEVKYQEHISGEDEKHLKYFLKEHPGWQAILITKKHESNHEIKQIPLWKWLLKRGQ